MDKLITTANGGKDYWGLVGEDSVDGAAERLKKEDSDGTDSDVSYLNEYSFKSVLMGQSCDF